VVGGCGYRQLQQSAIHIRGSHDARLLYAYKQLHSSGGDDMHGTESMHAIIVGGHSSKLQQNTFLIGIATPQLT